MGFNPMNVMDDNELLVLHAKDRIVKHHWNLGINICLWPNGTWKNAIRMVMNQYDEHSIKKIRLLYGEEY